MGIKYGRGHVEQGREFRFRGDLYSQESTFPLVVCVFVGHDRELFKND